MSRPITTAGAIRAQYRFPIAPGVNVHPGHFYGFNADGHLVAPGDASGDRRIVYAQERATGDTAATRKALCAVSVIVIIPKGTLTPADRGKSVFADSEQSAVTAANGHPCGVLLDVDGTNAAINLA